MDIELKCRCAKCKAEMSFKRHSNLCYKCTYDENKKNKEQHEESRLIRKYNITASQYKEIMIKQSGLCAICNQPETAIKNGKIQALAIDHCHETKKVRGLLCGKCNTALGLFKDNVTHLENAIKYLQLGIDYRKEIV